MASRLARHGLAITAGRQNSLDHQQVLRLRRGLLAPRFPAREGGSPSDCIRSG